MRVIAIDPGVTGAVAVVERGDGGAPVLLHVSSLADVDEPALAVAALVEQYEPDGAAIEQTSGSRGAGSASSHKLGASFGELRTALLLSGIAPSHIWPVRPHLWKSGLRLPADKTAATDRARAVFGDRFGRDHNQAEAVLIGCWALLKYGSEIVRADARKTEANTLPNLSDW